MGKRIVLFFLIGLFYFTFLVSAQFKFDPQDIECPADCKEIGGYYLPKIVSDLPANDLEEFRSNSSYTLGTDSFDVFGDFLGEWQSYEPMNEKVNELIEGKDSDYEKALAILNWVKSSKTYCTSELESQGVCTSKANNQDSYEDIFNSDYGVCLDATFIAVPMLRRAGIPALAMHVSMDHIDVLYNAENKWYIYDPIPCQPDQNISWCINKQGPILLGEDRILAWYHDSKAIERDISSGMYCDMSGFCYDSFHYSWQKHLFFSDNLVEAFLPNKLQFRYVVDRKTNHYNCAFKAGDLICDSYGCGYFEGVSISKEDVSKWNLLSLDGNSFETGVGQTFYGYVYSRIPAEKHYKYECRLVMYENEPRDEIISLNYFNPAEGEVMIISPNILEKFPGADESLFLDLKTQMLGSLEDINLEDYLHENRSAIEVDFEEGWNLIHGFQNPNQLVGGEISTEDIEAVYGFNPAKQEYVRIYPDVESEKLEDILNTNPVQYLSFWVYSSKQGSARYRTLGFMSPENQTLYPGWNFIGVTNYFQNKSLNELNLLCDISKAYAFVEGSWYNLEGLMDEKLFNNEEVRLRGIVVKTTGECSFEGDNQSLIEGVEGPSNIPGEEEEKCVDSDGGKDIYTKGTISGISLSNQFTTEEDFCVDGNIIEFFCNDETNNIRPQNRINNEGMACPTGYECSDGACIEEV